MKPHLFLGSKPFIHTVVAIASLFFLAPAWSAPRIPMPGGAGLAVVSTWIQDGQVFMRSEDGRLFCVPLDTPGLEAFLQGRQDRAAREPSSVPAGILTVQDILELLRAGISEETLRAYIAASEVRYVISKESLLALKEAGASEPFLQFLLETGPEEERQVESEPPDSIRLPYASDSVLAGGIPYYPYVFPGVGYAGPSFFLPSFLYGSFGQPSSLTPDFRFFFSHHLFAAPSRRPGREANDTFWRKEHGLPAGHLSSFGGTAPAGGGLQLLPSGRRALSRPAAAGRVFRGPARRAPPPPPVSPFIGPTRRAPRTSVQASPPTAVRPGPSGTRRAPAVSGGRRGRMSVPVSGARAGTSRGRN